MKHNTIIFNVCSGAVVAAALLTSCQSEDFGYSQHEVARSKYDRDFIQTFGQPQEGHQWGFDLPNSGNVTRATTVPGAPEIITPGELITARIMCEDMGGINSDFDFNDIVFDVAYNGSLCYVTMQAVGGTLPLELHYSGTQLTKGNVTEVHAMMGADVKNPVNVGASNGASGTALTWVLGFGDNSQKVTINRVEYPVIAIQEEFDLKKFKMKVEGSTSQWIDVNYQTCATPLCICVPTTTAWCQEGKRIDTAYGKFTDWVKDQKDTFWSQSIEASLLCPAATSPVPEFEDGYSDTDQENLAPVRH